MKLEHCDDVCTYHPFFVYLVFNSLLLLISCKVATYATVFTAPFQERR